MCANGKVTTTSAIKLLPSTYYILIIQNEVGENLGWISQRGATTIQDPTFKEPPRLYKSKTGAKNAWRWWKEGRWHSRHSYDGEVVELFFRPIAGRRKLKAIVIAVQIHANAS